MRIGDVGGVVIEGRQRADAAAHDRHRMRVAAEALEEAAHLLVHHRVMGHAVVEVGLLRRRRQFAVEQQVAGLEEVAVLGELLDRIAAIEQDALVAVDIGDLGLAARGRGEAGIVGEDAGLAVELADVDDGRADRSVVDRERPALVADGELCRIWCWRRVFASMIEPSVQSLADPTPPADAMASLGKSAGKVLYLRRSSSQCALQDGRQSWQRGTAGSSRRPLRRLVRGGQCVVMRSGSRPG